MPLFKPKNNFSFVKTGEDQNNLGRFSTVTRSVVDYQINLSGVPCYVYRLEGTHAQSEDFLGVKKDQHGTTEEATDIGSFMGIQDPLLMENRDRKYNFEEVPVLRGIYSLSESEIELMRFGFSTNETLSIEFSIESVDKMIGRNLIIGDVIELPHRRKVGLDGRVANRWYEVSSITYSPYGVDLMYQPHVIAVIMKPLRHQQEFLDILENVKDEDTGETLAQTASNFDQAMAITEAIQDKAAEHTPTTMFDTSLMYFDPKDKTKKPDRYTDDGLPPNMLPVSDGNSFPPDPEEYEWFIRSDHVPNRLYQFVENRWVLREIDRKREWRPYNFTSHMETFMNNLDENGDEKYKLRTLQDTITTREDNSDPT